MEEKIQLTITVAEQILYNGFITIIVLPATEGAVTISPGHFPQYISLTKGIIEFITQENYNRLEIEGGVAHIQPDQISIVTS